VLCFANLVAVVVSWCVLLLLQVHVPDRATYNLQVTALHPTCVHTPFIHAIQLQKF
jgi:hypothetical protein